MKSLAKLNQERILKLKDIFEHYLGMFLVDNDDVKFISVKDKKLVRQLFRQLNEIR